MDSTEIKALVSRVRASDDPARLAIEIVGAMSAVITRQHGAKHAVAVLRSVVDAMERSDG